MALIECPECGATISNKAVNCIHCGFPIKDYIEQYDSYEIVIEDFDKLFARSEAAHLQGIVMGGVPSMITKQNMNDRLPITFIDGVSKKVMRQLRDRLEEAGCITTIYKSDNPANKKYIENAKMLFDGDSVFCPNCGSTKIQTGKRGYSLFTQFIGSNSTVNRCAKCGYHWNL